MPGAAEDDLGARTERTLGFLREARASYREEKRRSNAYVGYLVALFAVFWVVPMLAAAARSGSGGRWHGDAARQVVAGLPVSVPALLALVLLLVARNATWRGPVLVDLPAVSWLLPLPVLRGPLLLPRLFVSVVRAGLVGSAVGAVAGYLLSLAGGGAWALLAAAGAWAGLTTAVTAVALGALVERYDRAVGHRGRWIFGAAWVATAVMLALAAGVWTGRTGSGPGSPLLRSGPWGWAAQPLVAAATPGAGAGVSFGAGPGGPGYGWVVGAVLSAACALVALLRARQQVPLIPVATLRSRATVASQLTASLFSLDLRQARSTVRGPRRRGSRPVLRLPVPRRRWLVVPWRDATGLLRAPGRPVWAALWTAAAVLLSRVAGQSGGQTVLCALPLVACYLAAAQLVEPARLESDNFRRSSGLPYAYRTLALWHALLPGALLLAGTGAGVALASAAGWWAPGHLALLAAVPALVGGALVSAYRGAVPLHVLTGGETAMGNTAPLQMALWYGRGPLGVLVLTVPVLTATARQGQFGVGQALWLLGVGAGALWWARRTAHRLHGLPPAGLRKPGLRTTRGWLRTHVVSRVMRLLS